MSARVAARIDVLRGRRRSPGRLGRTLEAAGVARESLARKAVPALCAGAAAGAVAFGLPGAIAGGPAVLGGAFLWLRKRAAARNERLESAFPSAVRAMADSVRAGTNVQQAIEHAAEEAPPPLDEELRRVVREIGLGVPVEEALSAFARRCPVPGAEVLAIALASAVRSGADVRPVLECILEAARDLRRLRGELRAATAQGRMTALVIGSLPVVFLFVLGTGARRELRFLFQEPLGWALLGAGVGLEAAGFAWMRRMGRVA